MNEEVRLFKSRHPKRSVIPLIVAGKPGDPESECFRPARFRVDSEGRITKKSVEPLAADVREEGDGKDLALSKVIAGLLGLSADDVYRRTERERRAATRRHRRVQVLIASLLAVLGAAGGAWWKESFLHEQWYWPGMAAASGRMPANTGASACGG